MQEKTALAFSFHGDLLANPHLSDYGHRLHFSPEGTVEMIDAAGQMVISIVKGQFALYPLDQDAIQVRFYDLVELHPYKDHEKVRQLEPMNVKVIREEGVFAFRGSPWMWVPRDTSIDEWPCRIYWSRYFFEIDPLEPLSINRRGSAYHLVQVEPDTRYYYSQNDLDVDTLTVADFADLGIALQPDTYARPEWKGKIVLGYR